MTSTSLIESMIKDMNVRTKNCFIIHLAIVEGFQTSICYSKANEFFKTQINMLFDIVKLKNIYKLKYFIWVFTVTRRQTRIQFIN